MAVGPVVAPGVVMMTVVDVAEDSFDVREKYVDGEVEIVETALVVEAVELYRL